jgi:hypothetical protein
MNLTAILRSGVLRVSRPKIVRGIVVEHPAVWFSLRRDWDPAVGFGWTGPDAFVLVSDVGGVARIGVAPETAPYTFDDYVRIGGLHPRAVSMRLAEDRDRLGSNPDDWRVSLDPVPASKWLRVEWRSGVRPGERWEPVG